MRRQQLYQYLNLMRLHRPVGIILLLWPTLWALLIASNGHLDLKVVVVFVLGVIIMRSAGCVVNDYADKDFDGQVKRTKNRPLATGQVSVYEAFALLSILLGIAFCLVLMLNRLTICLAFVGAALAIFYPFTKRFTHLPQLFLGLAYAWCVPMVFVAIQETVPPIAWLLFFAAWLWPIAYDTLYAMVDRDDDLRIGIGSTAIFFGKFDRSWVAVIQIVMLLTLFWIGVLQQYTLWYYLGLGCAGLLMLYQQHMIKHRDPDLCFKAFLNNQWVGLVIFLGLLFNDFNSI